MIVYIYFFSLSSMFCPIFINTATNQAIIVTIDKLIVQQIVVNTIADTRQVLCSLFEITLSRIQEKTFLFSYNQENYFGIMIKSSV